MTSIAQFAIFLRKIVYYEGPFNNRCALGLTAALLKEKNDDATDEVWLSYYKHGEWVWLQNVLFVEIDKKVLQHWSRVGGETCSTICFRLQSMHTLSTNMWLQIERKVLHSMSLFIWMKLVFSSMPSNVASTNKCCCWCTGGIKTGLL